MRWEEAFPCDPRSVTEARHAVRGVLAGWGVDERVAETAQLLVTEAVANGVRHAHSDVRLVVDLSSRLRIETWDEDPRSRPRPQHAPPIADHGRGMDLIEALSLQWGCDQRGGSKRVWFELPARLTAERWLSLQ